MCTVAAGVLLNTVEGLDLSELEELAYLSPSQAINLQSYSVTPTE
jgi:hypothetical protein